jgi:hypothetical protein
MFYFVQWISNYIPQISDMPDIEVLFIRPSRDGPYDVIGYGGWAGVHTGFCTITLESLGQRSRSLLL